MSLIVRSVVASPVLALGVLAAALSGCTSPEPLLADVQATASGGYHEGAITISIFDPGCPTLASSVHATADGHAMTTLSLGQFTAAASAFGNDTCEAPLFSIAADQLADRAITSFQILDGTTTWSIDVAGLQPSHWTFESPARVVEGIDFTYTYAPAADAGSPTLDLVAEIGIPGYAPTTNPRTIETGSTADSRTVHIYPGELANYAQLWGTEVSATAALRLDELRVARCDGPSGCYDFTTSTPAQHITIAVPHP
jgi:hypothetical protein